MHKEYYFGYFWKQKFMYVAALLQKLCCCAVDAKIKASGYYDSKWGKPQHKKIKKIKENWGKYRNKKPYFVKEIYIYN